MFRTMLNDLFAASWTGLIGQSAIASLLIDRKGRVGIWLARHMWAKGLLKIGGVDLHVMGDDALVESGKPYVIIANHQGYYDVPSLVVAIKGNLRIIAKQELFRIPIFGHFLKYANFPRVDRASPEAARRSMKKTTDLIRQGFPILVFVEGTRSSDGNIGPFQKGGFVLAIEAQVPIQPVVIAGSYQVLNKNHHHFQPGPIVVNLLRPIGTKGLTYSDRDDLLNEVRDTMLKGFEEASKRYQELLGSD